MPLDKAQSVLKRVLPPKVFDGLYNIACNSLDLGREAKEHIFYIPSYFYYELIGNKEAVKRIETVQKVLSHTMVSKIGVLKTYDICYKASQELDGCFVECGVARGGCSAVMAMVAREEFNDRKVWMFDSYEGLPLPTNIDGIQKPIRHSTRNGSDLAQGYCLGTYKEVEDWMFPTLKLSRYSVFMIKGWFQDILPEYRTRVGNIAVLRIDCDWYESTKCCLENLYGNVVKGGYIIIDDYNLQGCKKAVDEFITDKEVKITLDVNKRAYWRK